MPAQGSEILVNGISYTIEEMYCSSGSADSFEGGGNDCYVKILKSEDFAFLYEKYSDYYVNNLSNIKNIINNNAKYERIICYFNKPDPSIEDVKNSLNEILLR